MDSLASQIIIQVLMNRMKLTQDRIWIRDQNRLIPTDTGLFLIVGIVNAPQIMSNITSMESVTVDDITTEHEITMVQQREEIMIDILSRNNDALLRNWEVVGALNSFYSQQLQEKNSFKLFRTPNSLINTSAAEGGSNINRFSISVSAFVWYRKDTKLNSPLGDYYDDFTQRVDDEQTIGTDNPLIEFEITPDTPAPP